eukprot:13543-Pelagomonas_calceolata.AAC.1
MARSSNTCGELGAQRSTPTHNSIAEGQNKVQWHLLCGLVFKYLRPAAQKAKIANQHGRGSTQSITTPTTWPGLQILARSTAKPKHTNAQQHSRGATQSNNGTHLMARSSNNFGVPGAKDGKRGFTTHSLPLRIQGGHREHTSHITTPKLNTSDAL